MQESSKPRTNIVRIVAVAAAALVLPLLPAGAGAATFTVESTDDGGSGSLRQAILDANTISGPHLIDATGIAGAIDLESGLPALDEEVEIRGPGAEVLTVRRKLDATLFHRVLFVEEDATVEVSGLTIANGDLTDFNGGGSGGGIANRGELTLREVVVEGNTAAGSAGWGGGIVNDGGELTLLRSIVRGNEVPGSDPDRTGGGIENRDGGILEVIESTVSGNEAHSLGGGINNRDGSMATILRSTISDNESQGPGSGGAGIANSGLGVIDTSTIAGNSGGPNGGGVLNHGGNGTLFLIGSTVSGNASTTGANLLTYSTIVIVKSTVISDPQGGGGNCELQGPVTSSGYNLSDGGFCGLTASTDQVGVDPQLGELADNGGPTETMALAPGSPAIDQGVSDVLDADQRLLPRPSDFPEVPNAAGGDGSDVGAFELQREVSDEASLPARLQIRRASVRNRRLVVAGSLDPAAAGERLVVRFRAGGRQVALRPIVRPNGQFRASRILRGPQRRARAGGLVVRFAGNGVLRAATERLRAARRAVALRINRARIEGNRLAVAGRVVPRARSRVRILVEFTRADGSPAQLAARVRVNVRGRFQARIQIPPAVRDEGARVSITHPGRGPLHGQRLGRNLGGAQ